MKIRFIHKILQTAIASALLCTCRQDEIITLQSHSKGQGVNLVFIGDGYDAKDVSKELNLRDMKEQVEHFFNIEPYRTYRDCSNIHTAIAVSPESGIDTNNTIRYAKFETTFTASEGLRGYYNAIFDYALKMPTVNKSNPNKSLITVTPNTSNHGGNCQMWENGSAIAVRPKSTYDYPLDISRILQHEAKVHGFGELADEKIVSNSFIPNDKMGNPISMRSSEKYIGDCTHSNNYKPVIHKGRPDILK